MKTRILVWDLPTRWFHWLLALSFAGAWLTADSERYRDVHVMLGYGMLGLIAFRLIWGFVGSRYARFTEFVRSPATALRYLKSLVAGKPQHYVGHNPAGAIAIVLLLLLGIVSGVSGWMTYNEWGGEWMEEGHEWFSNLMLAVVGIHVVGVIIASRVHRENLVRAMFTGFKQGEPEQGIRGNRWSAIPLLVALVGTGFWGLGSSGKLEIAPSADAARQQISKLGANEHHRHSGAQQDDDG